MAIVYLSLGSNLGNKKANLSKATEHIGNKVGKVLAESSIFESNPEGFESDNIFYNTMISVDTHLGPSQLLERVKIIEKLLGRTKNRDKKYADRVIDIDIVIYDTKVVDTEGLTIPHPRAHLREFVLVPLIEIAPDIIHPAYGKSAKRLLADIREQKN